MMSRKDRTIKRVFDLVVSAIALTMIWWIIVLAWVIASIETRSNGMFRQKRIGKEGKPFFIYKIKTMSPRKEADSTVTTANDSRITRSGRWMRRYKIDELPQLFNVLKGDMSLVGPRPDVEGFADRLEGEDRIVLSVRPGITGPASLEYRDEETLLARQTEPERYNREVIWPHKVAINKEYVKHWSFSKDLYYLWKTITG